MTYPQIKNIFFFIASWILFFAEMTGYGFMQKYDIYFLLCFFITLTIYNTQKRTIVAPLFLMSVLSYVEMNIFGWCLVYIVPTIMFANYLLQNVRIKIVIPYLLLTFALCLKIIVAYYLHDITISWLHATQIIVYNTLILSVFLALSSHVEKQYTIEE